MTQSEQPPAVNGYRKAIQDVFNSRKKKNRKYSLRAFARDLDVNISFISRLLQSRRNLSLRMAEKFANKLFKDKKRKDAFIKLVKLELTTLPENWSEVADRLTVKAGEQFEIQSIDLTKFKRVSQWHHFAIMDLLTLKNPPATEAEISDFLGITHKEAAQAILDLEKADLLTRDLHGFAKKYKFISTAEDIPSDIGRNFHKQMIERGLKALEAQSLDRRFFYAETIAIQKKYLPDLKAAAEEFIARAVELANISDGEADSLYQANVQFYDHNWSRK